MTEYHKIQTVFLRDPETKSKTLLEWRYAEQEFQYLADLPWIWTEKVDGTNVRVEIDAAYHDCEHHYSVSFYGRTDYAQMPPFLTAALEETFFARVGIAKMAETFPRGAVLYGEGYGAKIQSGGNYRPDQGFVLFDVRVGDIWLNREDVEDVAIKLGIDVVPVIEIGTLPEMVEFVRRRPRSTWGDFPMEGIVARPAVELSDRRGRRIITKLKAKDFPVTPAEGG